MVEHRIGGRLGVARRAAQQRRGALPRRRHRTRAACGAAGNSARLRARVVREVAGRQLDLRGRRGIATSAGFGAVLGEATVLLQRAPRGGNPVLARLDVIVGGSTQRLFPSSRRQLLGAATDRRGRGLRGRWPGPRRRESAIFGDRIVDRGSCAWVLDRGKSLNVSANFVRPDPAAQAMVPKPLCRNQVVVGVRGDVRELVGIGAQVEDSQQRAAA